MNKAQQEAERTLTDNILMDQTKWPEIFGLTEKEVLAIMNAASDYNNNRSKVAHSYDDWMKMYKGIFREGTIDAAFRNWLACVRWMRAEWQASQGWVSVEERLPELDKAVLLFDDWVSSSGDGKRYQDVRVGYLNAFVTRKTNEGEVRDCEWKSEFAFNITHWRPLPKPPKQ